MIGTEVGLSETLKAFLDSALNGTHLEKPQAQQALMPGALHISDEGLAHDETSQGVETVSIYESFVPPDDTDVSYFPYVSIFLVSGSFEQDRCTAKVQFDCGTYSSEEYGVDAHKALLNLMRRICFALATVPNGWLDGRYHVEAPIEWSVSDIDRGHFFQGGIQCTFAWDTPKELTLFEGV